MRAEKCRHIKDARWEMLETGFRSAEQSLRVHTATAGTTQPGPEEAPSGNWPSRAVLRRPTLTVPCTLQYPAAFLSRVPPVPRDSARGSCPLSLGFLGNRVPGCLNGTTLVHQELQLPEGNGPMPNGRCNLYVLRITENRSGHGIDERGKGGTKGTSISITL